MIPEQIERLRESLSGLTSDEAFVEVAVYDLRALLAEWEERSAFAKEADRCWHAETMAKLKAEAEIERLKADIAWQEERNANNVRAYTEEIERLRVKYACAHAAQVDAEARLAKAAEMLREAESHAELGWNLRVRILEWLDPLKEDR